MCVHDIKPKKKSWNPEKLFWGKKKDTMVLYGNTMLILLCFTCSIKLISRLFLIFTVIFTDAYKYSIAGLSAAEERWKEVKENPADFLKTFSWQK